MANEIKYNIYAWVNDGWVQVNDDLDSYTKSEVDAKLLVKADANGVYTKTEVDNLLGDYYTKTEIDSTITTLTTQVNTNTSDISTIQTDLTGKADSDSVYTKTATDSLLGDKADKSTTYTKTEVDTELGKKADQSTTYTKTEVDTAITTAFTNADLYQIVTELPTTNIATNKIYLKLNGKSDAGNLYDLYLRVNDAWEKIDSIEINVADFAPASTTYSKTEVDGLVDVKANSSDVYTKTATDDLLDDKADKSTTYTKTEVDGLLDDKADSSTVYSKTETNNLLNDKANSNDVYAKTETYSSSEVDSAISTAVGNHKIVKTVSSLPATGEETTLYLVPVSNNNGE